MNSLRTFLALAAPYFRSEERWRARGLLLGVVGAELGVVYALVAFNHWNAYFFNAIQDRDWEDFRYALVLLDMRMPGMSGEEVCRRIREDQRHAALPVIAYTAHSTPEEEERILAAGFSGLLVKPTSFADLREACEGLFAAAP